MLGQEDFMKIQALSERGVYQKDIAEEMGVHPRTVRRALKRGSAPSGGRRRRGSKLEPYHAAVDRLLGEGVWNAVVVLRKIQALGYEGGLTVLREYIGPKRPLRMSRATVRFETEPGQQMQNDWGELWALVGGERRKVYFQVNTLGYSRRFHLWCTDSLDAEHTYEGIIRSFEYFGGTARQVLVDNQKSAVLEHPLSGGPRFNPRFLDLAGLYGFEAKACKPGRARTKGKVERMVGYVKGNFFQHYREFTDLTHMNQLAESWLAEEADPRVHGTVGEVVAERFERERPSLGALPAARYDTSYLEQRRVGWDGYVDVRGNRYSVPGQLAGETVNVRIGLDASLRVYAADQLVANHMLQDKASGWACVPEHHSVLWKETLAVEKRSLSVYEEVASWS
jgi:transposase